jgi:hypothetical protein
MDPLIYHRGDLFGLLVIPRGLDQVELVGQWANLAIRHGRDLDNTKAAAVQPQKGVPYRELLKKAD